MNKLVHEIIAVQVPDDDDESKLITLPVLIHVPMANGISQFKTPFVLTQVSRFQVDAQVREFHAGKIDEKCVRRFYICGGHGLKVNIKSIPIDEEVAKGLYHFFPDFGHDSLYEVTMIPFFEDDAGKIIDESKKGQVTSETALVRHQQQEEEKIITLPAEISWAPYLGIKFVLFESSDAPILKGEEGVLLRKLKDFVHQNWTSFNDDFIKIDNFKFKPALIKSVSPFKSSLVIAEYFKERLDGFNYVSLYLSLLGVTGNVLEQNLNKFIEEKVFVFIKVMIYRATLFAIVKKPVEIPDVIQCMMVMHALEV